MLAALDAGSNTLRLLVGEVRDGRVVPRYYLRRICRLAGGYSPEKGLSPEARRRALAVFREFAEACRMEKVLRIRAVGTAAFRRAVNGAAFVQEVREATQLPLEIISGEQEAEYMSSGVLSALDPIPEYALLVDIGGGSTEFVLCCGRRVVWSRSLPLGVVTLTEGHGYAGERRSAVTSALDGLLKDLAAACRAACVDPTELALVGTAGTATTLAALDMEMLDYDWRRVNNYSLALERLKFWQARLVPLSLAEREALPGMDKGRADLLPAGLEIMLALMHRLRSSRLTVSDFGILEGLLLSMDGRPRGESTIDTPALFPLSS